MVLLIRNKIRGGISSVMGDKYVKSIEKKDLYTDATNLFGHSRSQLLPFDDIKFERNVLYLKMFLLNMWKKNQTKKLFNT